MLFERDLRASGKFYLPFTLYTTVLTGHIQKAVMIAHRNVIANMMQIRWHEEVGRRAHGVETQVQIGLLPLSHIYGLVVVAAAGIYRGDNVVILPRFELKTLLECVQKFKVNMMHLVSQSSPSSSILFISRHSSSPTPPRNEKTVMKRRRKNPWLTPRYTAPSVY